MKIGEISKETGVSQRMIRHFEAMGLMSPSRVGKYRSYCTKNVVQIERIKSLQDQGLSLREIRTVLEGSDEVFEIKLIESLKRNKKQMKDLEKKNQLIWESLQSLKLNSSGRFLIKEGIIMEFLKSFEEKNIVRGRMPYLEVLYETFVHLSSNHYSMKWENLSLKTLHSTDLIYFNEEIDREKKMI